MSSGWRAHSTQGRCDISKPDAPRPPDPKTTAAAQIGTNVSTAIANNTMGMVDQYTPDGSLTNEIIGYESITDPYTGVTNQVPRYKQTTSLSEMGQATKDQSDAAGLNLATTANQQSDFLKDYLSQPFQGDTAALEARLDELMRQRADPRFARDEEALRTRLTNQGISAGSEAWRREMESFGQNKNDAYNQMYLNGRGQAFSELQALRNQPINEITALLSGSQVSNPNVQGATPQGMPNTDVAGLINQNYNQRLSAWQQNMANSQSLLGGMFGLGSSAIMASDIRLKTDIRRVGTTDGGLPVFTYRYVTGGPVQMGVMAQDVLLVAPEAVHDIGGGYLGVDYAGVR